MQNSSRLFAVATLSLIVTLFAALYFLIATADDRLMLLQTGICISLGAAIAAAITSHIVMAQRRDLVDGPAIRF